jgi:hypothetical protein
MVEHTDGGKDRHAELETRVRDGAGPNRRSRLGRWELVLERKLYFFPLAVLIDDLTSYADPDHGSARIVHGDLEIESLLPGDDPGADLLAGLTFPLTRRVSEQGLRGLTTGFEGAGHLDVSQPVRLEADPVREATLIDALPLPIVASHLFLRAAGNSKKDH